MQRQKCENADQYKAQDAPRCGCQACWMRWEAKLRAMAARKRRVLERN